MLRAREPRANVQVEVAEAVEGRRLRPQMEPKT